MTSLKSEHMMVVAIDFGTTYSGYAFSLGCEFESDPAKISSNSPWIASQGLVSHKTPTCVLLHPDKSFYKFGYEAEDTYNEIAEDESKNHKDFYYFRRFKMFLHTRTHFRRETVIEDETGKSLPAMDVFVHSICYLKNHALKTFNTQGKLIDEMDIHWVITVPAIWSDGAKQFMREAAQRGGIESNNLSIALEPEAASVYCKYLPSHQLSNGIISSSMFQSKSKYMVIDLGGGTADITVHLIEADSSICEVHSPSGGAWGGTKVDDAFIGFLTEIFGKTVMHEFFDNHMDDVMDLYREFELRKRKVKMDMSETPEMAIKIPVALYELYENRNGRKLINDIKTHEKYKDKVKCLADKMKIDANILKSFFKKPLDSLVEHIRDTLGELQVRGTDTFIMVGGFSESEIVQDTIRTKFPNMKVITPFDAGLAVLKGAVIFGHSPMIVTARVCRQTYGMAVSKAFVEGKHPPEKKEIVGDKEIVRDVFHKYMEQGQHMKVGQAVSTVPLSAAKGQKQARVRVFSSKDKNPSFVTDPRCMYLGEIIVYLPDNEDDDGGTVEVKMTFGGTELAVEALEKKSGKSYKSRFDFLTN